MSDSNVGVSLVFMLRSLGIPDATNRKAGAIMLVVAPDLLVPTIQAPGPCIFVPFMGGTPPVAELASPTVVIHPNEIPFVARQT